MHSQTWHGKAEWDDDHWGLNVEAGSSKADGGSKHQVFLEFLNWSDYTVDIGGAPKAPGTISYPGDVLGNARSEEHTSELQSLMRISYAVFCLKKKKKNVHMTLPYHTEFKYTTASTLYTITPHVLTETAHTT